MIKIPRKKIEQYYAFLIPTGWFLCFSFSIYFMAALTMLKVKHHIPKHMVSCFTGFSHL